MRHEASGLEIGGEPIDQQTRCVHYATERDIVAIKFACCGQFSPCHACHDAGSDHERGVWPVAQRGERALLCGQCGITFPIATYLSVDGCPHCAAEFNPGCRDHQHLYFEA